MILYRISSGTKLKIDGNHVITKLTRLSEKQQAFSSPGARHRSFSQKGNQINTTCHMVTSDVLFK